jgi:hypothetical protein
MKSVSMHYSPDWTPEKDLEIRENRAFFAETAYRSVANILSEYSPNYNLGIRGRTVFRGLCMANRFGFPEDVFNCLYYFNQLNYAWFLITTHDRKPISFTIANKVFDIVGKFKNSEISSTFVIQGIQTAMLLRDQNALDFYATIPVTFTEQANQQDLVLETMMYFHQTLVKGIENPDEAAAAYHHVSSQLEWDEYKKYIALEGFNTSSVWKDVFEARVPIFKSLFLPVLAIYNHILNADQAAFEQAVHDALIAWKAYYTLPKFSYADGQEEDRATDPSGYFALPIAAACAFAFDRGMKLLTVKSDYIPIWMIEGRFDHYTLKFG